jgi:hypothetical protein
MSTLIVYKSSCSLKINHFSGKLNPMQLINNLLNGFMPFVQFSFLFIHDFTLL